MTIYNGLLELVDIAIIATIVFFLIILYTRIVGLRSFAKMSCTDFATTIAIGSMIASVILPKQVSIVGGCFAILTIYILQWSSSWLKIKSTFFSSLIENSPAIVMKEGQVLHNELSKVNMSENDLKAKLREANVLDIHNVKYVVFESTGDVSVIHGQGELSDYIISDL